ncbi:glycerol-3-phosphate 1-O-acyltransferase PlsY [Eubacteriales bacterium OttesenSCG-928-K08]|nr:glycerol-3-phosphate 1-O-acyltransferase PlsY [Eubacteriales bacterium OttesenSCG-928-K08]
MTLYLVLAALLGYLLGNVQSAVIISRLKFHDDVRNHGSGNAGSTNMLRVYGLKPGLTTFVFDSLKGIFGVLVGRWLAGETGAYAAALFVVIGHDFPVLFKFKGGKGVASTLSILWMLSPKYGAIVTVIAIIILLSTRIVSLTSITSMTIYLLLVLIFEWGNVYFLLLITALWALMLVRHVDNIKRLLRGEESRLFERKKQKSTHNG